VGETLVTVVAITVLVDIGMGDASAAPVAGSVRIFVGVSEIHGGIAVIAATRAILVAVIDAISAPVARSVPVAIRVSGFKLKGANVAQAVAVGILMLAYLPQNVAGCE
jgi:hypothetical protein